MLFSKTKKIIAILILLTSCLMFTGCTSQSNSWVNTNSMPGHTFKKYVAYTQNTHSKNSSSNFGPPPIEKNIQFGPRDVSFDFKNLNR